MYKYIFYLTAGKDYSPVSEVVFFAPGQYNTFIKINIFDDNVIQESDITFSLNISVKEKIIAQPIVTILDDDYNPNGKLTKLNGIEQNCWMPLN